MICPKCKSGKYVVFYNYIERRSRYHCTKCNIKFEPETESK